MALLTGVILLVVGLLACFFGWRLYRLMLGLFGFVIGYYVVLGLLAEQAEIVQIGGAIVAGLVVGFIFWALYNFAYILFGVFLGIIVAGVIGNAFNLEGIILLVVVVILATIGGVLGAVLADVMIRLGTAFGGASQAVGGVAAIATALNIGLPLADPTHGGANTESTAGIITLVAVIILGVIGFIFQTQNAPEMR